jgi:hypothetical protein
MPLICNLAVNERFSVRLVVSQSYHEVEMWDWMFYLQTGDIMPSGSSVTRLAASQTAPHEYWLHQNRKPI